MMMHTLFVTTAIAELSKSSMKADVVNLPDWWKRLNEKQRRAYLINHPRSKYKRHERLKVIEKLSLRQRREVKKFLRNLSGQNGLLTKEAQDRLRPEKISKEDKKKIADNLRKAKGEGKEENTDTKGDEGQGRGRRPKRGRSKFGIKAIALTMMSAGLLVIGGAALVAAGVPLDVFTPELVSAAWKHVQLDSDDDTVVGNLCAAIKKKLYEGNTDEELENALLLNGKRKEENGGV